MISAQCELAVQPTHRETRRRREDAVIRHALSILSRRIAAPGHVLGCPQSARDYLRLSTGTLEHEVFTVAFLDVKNRVIACEQMFRGTLTHSSVYPREVVKAALAHNASAVMLGHNHPSGVTEPSEADQLLTRALVQALGLIDVRVLDHIIVTASESYSMAEHGLM